MSEGSIFFSILICYLNINMRTYEPLPPLSPEFATCGLLYMVLTITHHSLPAPRDYLNVEPLASI
jgi:hypothetical protein